MEGDRLLPTHKLSFSPSSKDAAECNNPAELASYPSKKSRNFQLRHHIFYIAICAVCLFIGFFASLTINSRHVRPQNNSDPQITCHSPATRREWRSLSDNEKGQYIRAVVCLSTKPSRLGTNNSLYDDFALVHHESDENVHFAASFLPWHRYFIYVYNRALAEECGYTGQLPYWDWTLDWASLSSSPVFDVSLGFSGNGVAGQDPSPHFPRSHCVVDGAFGNMTVAYVGGSHSPHCLTRDFGSNLSFHETPKQLSPSAVEALLSEDDYYKFLVNFEATTHVAIPKFIMGDFRFSTSPNDPIFFLHHAQVDRVWWQWQMYSLDRRLAYGGKFKAKESKLASPDDAISIGGLAPDIKVRDIMDVRSGLLCYRY